jgi:hypothetical protein
VQKEARRENLSDVWPEDLFVTSLNYETRGRVGDSYSGPGHGTGDPVDFWSTGSVIAGRKATGDVLGGLLAPVHTEVVSRLALIVIDEDFMFFIGESSSIVIHANSSQRLAGPRPDFRYRLVDPRF